MQGNADVFSQLLSLLSSEVIGDRHLHIVCLLRFGMCIYHSEGTDYQVVYTKISNADLSEIQTNLV
jgi:hypothetical protein